jgi:hypothetical protein
MDTHAQESFPLKRLTNYARYCVVSKITASNKPLDRSAVACAIVSESPTY